MKARKLAVRETVNAGKERFGAEDVAALMKGAKRLVVAKAKKVTELDPRELDQDELAAAVLGPTGNLRAPTAKVGATWLVGFLDGAWAAELG